MAIVDRWHKSRPGEGEPRCREHDLVPSADHGKGERWQVRYRDDSKRQLKKNFPKKTGTDPNTCASAFDAKVRDQLNTGTYVDPAAGKQTLKSYADEWLAAQTFDESTHQATELRLRLHVYPTLGDKQLRMLAQRPSVIQAWVRGLQQKLAANYVRVIFANLSAVLSAALDDNLITKNPCRAGSVKPPAPERKKVVPWPHERVAAMRMALPERYAVVVDEGAGVGLRQGEAFGLGVDDIDFLRGVVHVRRQVKILGSRLVFAPPKGGKSRDVPLAESASLRFAAHLEAFPAVSVTLPWQPTGKPMTVRLLVTSRERGAVNRNYFNMHIWKPGLVTAGVIPTPKPGERFDRSREHGMHALRHYFASVALENGVSIKALSEYLGHADPGFTLRTYTHLMPESEERMRKAVDRAFAAVDGLASALVVPSGGARNA